MRVRKILCLQKILVYIEGSKQEPPLQPFYDSSLSPGWPNMLTGFQGAESGKRTPEHWACFPLLLLYLQLLPRPHLHRFSPHDHCSFCLHSLQETSPPPASQPNPGYLWGGNHGNYHVNDTFHWTIAYMHGKTFLIKSVNSNPHLYVTLKLFFFWNFKRS